MAQLFAFLVCPFEYEPVAKDLRFELGAAAAFPPVEVVKFPLGGCQLFDRALAQLLEVFPLVYDKAHCRIASRAALVDRERFGGGAFEGAGGTLRRSDWVGVAERGLAFDRVRLG